MIVLCLQIFLKVCLIQLFDSSIMTSDGRLYKPKIDFFFFFAKSEQVFINISVANLFRVI